MQIKADKHQLYQLVAEMIAVPPENDTEFRKDSGGGFFLLWDNDHCWAFLAGRSVSALLVIKTPNERKARGLLMDELRERGLVKEE